MEKTFPSVTVVTDDYQTYQMTLHATVLDDGALELKKVLADWREVELNADEEYAAGFVFNDPEIVDAIEQAFAAMNRRAREYREQVEGDYWSAVGAKL